MNPLARTTIANTASRLVSSENIAKTSRNLQNVTSQKRPASNEPLPDNPAKRVLVNIPISPSDVQQKFCKLDKLSEDYLRPIYNNIAKCSNIILSILNDNQDQNSDFFDIGAVQDMENVLEQSFTRNKKFFLNGKNCSLGILDNDIKTILICYDKDNRLKENFNITYYKKDPEIDFIYNSQFAKITMHKNRIQDIKIDEGVFHFDNHSKNRESYLNYSYLDNGKKIDLTINGHKPDNTQVDKIFYSYTEKSDTQIKGLFLNEKANEDNHTGIIAFTPKSFENCT